MRAGVRLRREVRSSSTAVALALLTAVFACEEKPGSGSGSGAGSGAVKTQETLTSEYKAMKPAERIEAARSACLVGDNCQGYEAEALIDAADSDAERDSLRQAARSSMLAQYQTKLAAKAKKPVSVQASEANTTTITVKGHCNKFVLEDFIGGPEKKQAKTLGFARIECNEAALNAAADF